MYCSYGASFDNYVFNCNVFLHAQTAVAPPAILTANINSDSTLGLGHLATSMRRPLSTSLTVEPIMV
jgi:hypothetical protein